MPHSAVLLRPDRFVAGMCSPQQVSQNIADPAGKLALQPVAPSGADSATSPAQHDVTLACDTTVALKGGA